MVFHVALAGEAGNPAGSNYGKSRACCSSCEKSGNGFAGAQSAAKVTGSYPGVQKALIEYIRREDAAGRSWYIAPYLNSDVTVVPADDPGLGFWQAIFAAVAKVATTVGPAVANALPHVATIVGQGRQLAAANAANAALIPQNIAIPQAAAIPVVNAVQNTGLDQKTVLLAGAAILAIVLLKK